MSQTPSPSSVPELKPGSLVGESFHLIGVGGVGMSVVATLLAEQGAHVTGSDVHEGPAFIELREAGREVVLGHDAANVPEDSVIVISSAIKESNPELAIARERRQVVVHRSQALTLIAEGKDFVAVAGAHGKTTTSAMLAQALGAAGQSPSFAIGGVVRSLGTGAHLGAGAAFVAEADESDRSFLNYGPSIALVTNVEPDHLDVYGTAEAFEDAFLDFAHCLVADGLLIACADDPGALRLAQHADEDGLRVVTYGTGAPDSLPGGALVGEAHIQLTITARSASGTSAVLTRFEADDEQVRSQAPVNLEVAVPGDHMALNAAGAWAAGLELGVEANAMAQALGTFEGTGRRFENRGEAAGVRVVDDYAHHPTEIEALLATARRVAQERGGRVLVLFQPHLFSRTRDFAERFGTALGQADLVIVTDVYPAREDQADYPGVSGSTVASRVPAGRARFVAGRREAARAVADQARAGDLVLTVGAGDVTELADVILERLGQRDESAAGESTGGA